MIFKLEMSLSDIITWILTIAGFIIAIWQFRVQMAKDRDAREKEQRTTWFLNVIVYPHLEKIHDFYQKVTDLTEHHIADLNANASIPHQAYSVLKAKKQNDLKKYIVDFFDFLSPLVGSYSSVLGTGLIAINTDLQDICTRAMDACSDSNAITLLRSETMTNKQRLLSKLNSELSIN